MLELSVLKSRLSDVEALAMVEAGLAHCLAHLKLKHLLPRPSSNRLSKLMLTPIRRQRFWRAHGPFSHLSLPTL